MKTINIILSIYLLTNLIFIENVSCQYPFNPTNTQHKIAGTIGEERGGRNRYHYGLDFSGFPAGTDVYAVETGPLRRKNNRSFAVGRIGYIHVVPNKFTGLISDFNVNQGGATSGNYPYIENCTSNNLTFIYSQSGSNHGIEFKEIIFTHDDVQLALGPVPTATTLCVDVGADGFYTESFRNSGPSYVSPNDEMVYTLISNLGRWTQQIVAGADLSCELKFPILMK